MVLPVVSIVIPIYNEERCLSELVSRLCGLKEDNEDEFQFQVIFVDDGSTDQSRMVLRGFSLAHDWIKAVRLSRNCGHQIAVTAGLDIALTDYVAIIDGDLQDPPELIPAMVRQLLRNQNQIVYGQRDSRKDESAFKIWTAHIFYRLIRRLSGLDIPLDTGDFRVMTKQARDALCQMREHNRFLRGLAAWTGLSSSAFIYQRDARHAGTSKYTFRSMLKLASNAVVSLSVTPLRAVQLCGVIILALGVVGLFIASVLGILRSDLRASEVFASLNAIYTGLILTAIGVIGGYLHRIQDDVRGRPLYMTEEI